MTMNRGSWFRRTATAGVLAVLAAAGVIAAGTPAAADTPFVALTVSPSTVTPGDTVTVTETVTNTNGFTILGPSAELFSGPDTLPGYATLTGCDAGAGGSCDTITDGGGNPVGYRAVFNGALGGNQQAVATFTLTIDPNSDSAIETFQGDLAGANFDSGRVDGPTLTINALADLGVVLTGTPVHSGLLGLNLTLDFTVTVTNNGPGTVRNAKVTAAVQPGLRAVGSSTCAATSGGALCSFGTIAKGHHATAKFTVPGGLLDIGLPFQFSAARTSSTPTDPNSANDHSAQTCVVVSVLLASCSAS
jgi:uncharacterized repeat protein (TIGR01451 family)